MTISITSSKNKEEYKKQAQILANYLPQGEIWKAKNIEESDLRKLLNAFGKEFVNVEDSLSWLKRELNIRTTFDLIDAWEELYGIPDNDGVFESKGKKIEERRFNLLFKELMNGSDRTEDWEYLASLLGYKIKVYPASKTSKFPYKFPIKFFENSKYAIQVDFYGENAPAVFPLQFPFTFGSNYITLIQKIFNIIKPSDCEISYRFIKDEITESNEENYSPIVGEDNNENDEEETEEGEI